MFASIPTLDAAAMSDSGFHTTVLSDECRGVAQMGDVFGLANRIPKTNKIYCLPIHAKLHLAGKNQKSEATLAKEMLGDILEWFPDRKLNMRTNTMLVRQLI